MKAAFYHEHAWVTAKVSPYKFESDGSLVFDAFRYYESENNIFHNFLLLVVLLWGMWCVIGIG